MDSNEYSWVIALTRCRELLKRFHLLQSKFKKYRLHISREHYSALRISVFLTVSEMKVELDGAS